jgi:hypothetical protein
MTDTDTDSNSNITNNDEEWNWEYINIRNDPLNSHFVSNEQNLNRDRRNHIYKRKERSVKRSIANQYEYLETRTNLYNYRKKYLRKSELKKVITPFSSYVEYRLPNIPNKSLNNDLSNNIRYSDILTDEKMININNITINNNNNDNISRENSSKLNIILPMTHVQPKDLLIHYLSIERDADLYNKKNKKTKSMIRFQLSDIKDTIKYIKENDKHISITGTKSVLLYNITEYYNLFMNIAMKRVYLIYIKNRLKKYTEIKKRYKHIYSWEVTTKTRKAYYDHSLCNNELDPITCESLKDISPHYYFVIKEKDKYYGYDLRSLTGIILHNMNNYTKYKNPLTQKFFDKDVYCDLLVRIYYLKMMNKSILYDEDEDQDENENQEQTDQVNIRIRNNIREILHNLNQLGYYISDEVVENFTTGQWIEIYRSLYNIWNYNITENIRRDISRTHIYNFIEIQNLYRYSENGVKTYVTELCKILIRGQSDNNDGTRGLVGLYLMVSLCSINSPISESYPHFVNIFDNPNE